MKVPEHIKEEIDRVYGKPQFEDQPPAGLKYGQPAMGTLKLGGVPDSRVKTLPALPTREPSPAGDNVVLPKHYARFEIEPIRFIGANGLNFFQGNVIKYILRYDAKNGLEDVRKAKRYCRMFELFLEGHPEWYGPDPEDQLRAESLKAIFEGFRSAVREHTESGTPMRGKLLNAITRLEATCYGAP